MWPHSLVIDVAGTAVCIGTDDADTAVWLEPLRITGTDAADPFGALLVDFALETHAASADQTGSTRPLPTLGRGTAAIARSLDTARLRRGLARCLGAIADPTAAGTVRLRTGALVGSDGGVVLVPTDRLGGLSERWLTAHGLEPLCVDTVDVDVVTRMVRIAPGLASLEPAATAVEGPLTVWFADLPQSGDAGDAELTGARRVAPLVDLIADPLAGCADAGASPAPQIELLTALLAAVEPIVIGHAPAEVRSALASHAGSPA